jgi:hypothetical protein
MIYQPTRELLDAEISKTMTEFSRVIPLTRSRSEDPDEARVRHEATVRLEQIESRLRRLEAQREQAMTVTQRFSFEAWCEAAAQRKAVEIARLATALNSVWPKRGPA